jgi:cysteate synthase
VIDTAKRSLAATELQSRCTSCGRSYPAIERACPECPGALLRADYPAERFEPRDDRGIFRYLDWLPPARGVDTAIGPTAYRAERLAQAVGINDLTVGFNGYAPELGAHNPTGSFKDFEALPTLLFLREHGVGSIVLASAGSTARAFACAGVRLGFRIHIIVPEQNLHRLWLPIEPTDDIRLTVIEGSRDYFKAIELSELVVREFGLVGEGGARNIARRDGMGTSLLEHARVRRALPRHYFQAVGSGTGGVAAWEASERLLRDGRFGDRPPVLNLAQNAPYTPIHDAWTHGRPIRPSHDVGDQLARIDRIDAEMLANRNPPFANPGGVRDALEATRGRTYAVSNREAREAAAMFLRTEGAPIGPAPAVALGALMQAVGDGRVKPHEPVMLNVTGNGDMLVRRDFSLRSIEPSLRVPPERVTPEHVASLAPHFAD